MSRSEKELMFSNVFLGLLCCCFTVACMEHGDDYVDGHDPYSDYSEADTDIMYTQEEMDQAIAEKQERIDDLERFLGNAWSHISFVDIQNNNLERQYDECLDDYDALLIEHESCVGQ